VHGRTNAASAITKPYSLRLFVLVYEERRSGRTKLWCIEDETVRKPPYEVQQQ